MYYISDSFCLPMLVDTFGELGFMRVEKVSPKEVPAYCTSIIQEDTTAQLISQATSHHFSRNRIGVRLHEGDILYVALHGKPAVQEGTKLFFERALKMLRFYKITISGDCTFGEN